MSNGWIAGVVVGLAMAAIGALFVIKRVRNVEEDVELSMPLPLVKTFRLRRAGIAFAIIAVGLVFCFGSLYMLYRSHHPNFSDKVGRYTGQAAPPSSGFNKGGSTLLAINSIDGENVQATLHSDVGLYADGQLAGTISGNEPVMMLDGSLSGSTGGWFSSESYATDVELSCQFPNQNQIECSYSTSPETEASISPQNGNMTLTKQR